MLEAHASVLAGWFYCGRKCVDQLNGIYPPKSKALIIGQTVHEWLSHRPRSPEEQTVAEALAKFRVKSKTRPNGSFFYRRYKLLELFGDIDDFLLRDDGLQILEFKTIGDARRIDQWWYICAYVFQVQIYCYILEPLLAQIGLKLADRHLLLWYTRKGLPIEKRDPRTLIRYDPHQVEGNLDVIQTAFHDRTKIIYPTVPWKCEYCADCYRQSCPQGRKYLSTITPQVVK